MNKLGVQDGQEQQTSFFWVSEEMGMALKYLAGDFPVICRNMVRCRIYKYSTCHFKKRLQSLRILAANIQNYVLHSYKSNFGISFQISTSMFALLTGVFCLSYHYTILNLKCMQRAVLFIGAGTFLLFSTHSEKKSPT